MVSKKGQLVSGGITPSRAGKPVLRPRATRYTYNSDHTQRKNRFVGKTMRTGFYIRPRNSMAPRLSVAAAAVAATPWALASFNQGCLQQEGRHIAIMSQPRWGLYSRIVHLYPYREARGLWVWRKGHNRLLYTATFIFNRGKGSDQSYRFTPISWRITSKKSDISSRLEELSDLLLATRQVICMGATPYSTFSPPSPPLYADGRKRKTKQKV